MIDKNTGIWSLETAKKRHRYDPTLAEAIYDIFLPKSIADLGCGTGSYCRALKYFGTTTVHGYEGTQDIYEIATYDDIMIIDLTKVRYVNITYDLVLCLEVGEHIPKEHEQVFIDNVCRYVSNTLVISWGLPGQGGKGHFNEQPLGYIINEMFTRDLHLDMELSTKLREAASLKWFKNNILVFKVKND